MLPALGRLAQAFQGVYTDQDKYIAGLWQADLFRRLLWMTKDSSLAVRPLDYRAPSWSWASVKGELDWPSHTIARHCHYNYTVKLVEAQSVTVPGGTFGAITGARMKLVGRCQRLDKLSDLQNGEPCASDSANSLLNHPHNYYDNPPSTAWMSSVTDSVGLVLTTLVIVARCYTKFSLTKAPGRED
ncbi:MAG: hypothetical protein Q9173_007143, partial [Seirophora scorigena]